MRGNHVSWIYLIIVSLLQSISAPGSGIWSDGKDKSEGAQAHTWNVEVLIDVLKELVSSCRQVFGFILHYIHPRGGGGFIFFFIK